VEWVTEHYYDMTSGTQNDLEKVAGSAFLEGAADRVFEDDEGDGGDSGSDSSGGSSGESGSSSGDSSGGSSSGTGGGGASTLSGPVTPQTAGDGTDLSLRSETGSGGLSSGNVAGGRAGGHGGGEAAQPGGTQEEDEGSSSSSDSGTGGPNKRSGTTETTNNILDLDSVSRKLPTEFLYTSPGFSLPENQAHHIPYIGWDFGARKVVNVRCLRLLQSGIIAKYFVLNMLLAKYFTHN
jgi:hypothetical protein